jgi:hypothetical protein
VNQQALTPMMTSITLSVVVGICARHHHVASDSEDTFSVSPALAYLMFAIGLLFCVVPFLTGTSGNIPPIQFFWIFTPFWGGAFLAANSLDRTAGEVPVE